MRQYANLSDLRNQPACLLDGSDAPMFIKRDTGSSKTTMRFARWGSRSRHAKKKANASVLRSPALMVFLNAGDPGAAVPATTGTRCELRTRS